MLSSFKTYNAIYIEITKSEHQHGGENWEFGRCLWSPSKASNNADRYAIMREPRKGDLILHFYQTKWDGKSFDSRLCGYSIVIKPFYVTNEIPPFPGPWRDKSPYYRIELDRYTTFPTPLPFSIIKDSYSCEILNELLEDKPRNYPFNTYGDTIRTVQGTYLAKCTERLFNLFIEALKIQVNYNQKSPQNIDIHSEYAETKRLAKERYFFSRNPKLAVDAKQANGYKCQACGFEFGRVYGSLGSNFIEAHHKKPISERPESKWDSELISKLDDIIVLCSNCHRMIHRKKPALTIQELVNILEQQKTKKL